MPAHLQNRQKKECGVKLITNFQVSNSCTERLILHGLERLLMEDFSFAKVALLSKQNKLAKIIKMIVII